MDNFRFPLKLLKICGFERFPSDQRRKVLKCLRYWNFLLTSYCILSSLVYVYNSNDVLTISETMSPTFTELFTIIKYGVFWINCEQFFDAVEEVEILNQKCELNLEEKSLQDIKFHSFQGVNCTNKIPS